MKESKIVEYISTPRLNLIARNTLFNNELWEQIDYNREYLREFLPWVDGQKSIDDVIKSTIDFDEEWEKNTEWCFIILDNQSKVIGCIGVHNIDFKGKNAELGYWIDERESNKGYMSEAVLAVEEELIKIGFDKFYIKCDIRNLPSSRVASRCGYVLTNIIENGIEIYGEKHDLKIYLKSI